MLAALIGVSFAAESREQACSSDLDCQLNGVCDNGVCQCDRAWQGVNCEQLRLKPTPLSSGYRPGKTSTWGGNIISETGVNSTKYHMWLAEMDGGCGLTSWRVNSQITHVVSSTPGGPYTRAEVTVPVWSHNPVVVRSNGTLVMFHIGTGQPKQAEFKCLGENGTSQCGLIFPCGGPTPQPRSPLKCSSSPGYACMQGYCSSETHSDGSIKENCGTPLSEPLLNCSIAEPDECVAHASQICNRTAGCEAFGVSMPWWKGPCSQQPKAKLFGKSSHKVINGDWFLFTRNSSTTTTSRTTATNHSSGRPPVSTLKMQVADSPEGPWKAYSASVDFKTNGNNPAPYQLPNGTLLVVLNDGHMSIAAAASWRGPFSLHSRGACGGGEDPFLYVDRRGHFHCLFHRSPFSDPAIAIGHAYSEDSYTWRTSPVPACGSAIEYESTLSASASGPGVAYLNSSTTVVFGKRERPHLLFDASGDPTHLITGVCINPECDPFANGQGKVPAGVDCSAKTQYTKCDRDGSPGFYDRTWTHVQEIEHEGAL